jgi:uncharacterized membrane protein YhaH (DUF805 family)
MSRTTTTPRAEATSRTSVTTKGTRSLLACGAVAGPLFVGVSLAQVPFREGFDMTRHAFSFLLNGPGGWVQTLNFVATGMLFGYAARGLGPALGGRAGSVVRVLLTVVGAGLVVAGLFAPQPSYGYPPGAPEGVPSDLTTSSVVHGIAFVVSVVCYCAALALAAWRLRRIGAPGWAAVCAAAAILLLAIPATQGQAVGTVVIYLAVTAAHLVTAALFLHLRAAMTETDDELPDLSRRP